MSIIFRKPKFTKIVRQDIVRTNLVFNVDAGISASWPGSGTTWYDLTNNNYDGTLVNGVDTTTYPGSFSFDAVSTYVNFGNVLNFSNTSPFTFCAWFRRLGTFEYSSVANILSKQSINDPYTGYQFGFNLSTGSTAGYFGIGTIGSYPSDAMGTEVQISLNDNDWHYGVATYDGSTNVSGFKLYLNAVQQTTVNFYGSSSTVSFANAINFEIGARDGAYQVFPGLISSVQVYDRVLTGSEVTQNFNAYRGRFGI